MLALYRSGSQADALRCYSRLRNTAQRGARHRAEPGCGRARTSDPQTRSLACLVTGRRERTLQRPTGTCTGPTTSRPSIDQESEQARPGAVESSDLSWCRRRCGRIRGTTRAELEVARIARGRGRGRRTALDACHRGARHRQDQADRGDRTRVRRGGRSRAARAAGTRSRSVRTRRFEKHSVATRFGLPEDVVQPDVGALAPVLARIVPEVLESATAPRGPSTLRSRGTATRSSMPSTGGSGPSPVAADWSSCSTTCTGRTDRRCCCSNTSYGHRPRRRC